MAKQPRKPGDPREGACLIGNLPFTTIGTPDVKNLAEDVATQAESFLDLSKRICAARDPKAASQSTFLKKMRDSTTKDLGTLPQSAKKISDEFPMPWRNGLAVQLSIIIRFATESRAAACDTAQHLGRLATEETELLRLRREQRVAEFYKDETVARIKEETDPLLAKELELTEQFLTSVNAFLAIVELVSRDPVKSPIPPSRTKP